MVKGRCISASAFCCYRGGVYNKVEGIIWLMVKGFTEFCEWMVFSVKNVQE